MKALYTLSAILLMAFSLQTFAADKGPKAKIKQQSPVFPAIPLVWGNPDEGAPEHLRYIKAKEPAQVNYSGDANKIANLRVPLAPMVWGDANKQWITKKRMLLEHSLFYHV